MPEELRVQASPGASASLERELYFPTYIYYADLPGAAAMNATLMQNIYAWKEEDSKGVVRSNAYSVGSWHSKVDMNRRPEYQDLCQAIVDTTQRVFNDQGYDPEQAASIDNMWANVNPKYGYNRNHVHPNSLWSGVYYVQVPEGAGRIFFTDPRPQVMFCRPRYPSGKRGPEAWTEVYYKPIEGRIILFPSWLVHEVEPNMSDLPSPAGDRVSISFNLHQRRRQSD